MATKRKTSKVQKLAPDSVKKPSGLKKDGTPNASWRKFSERLEEYDNSPIKEWKAENLLGYIFKRYSDHYETSFSLSYSGPPSKCSEIYCVKRMLFVLNGENIDMELSKSYVDWAFDKIIIPKKMEIQSLAFFFTAKLIREFKSQYKKLNKITRANPLPKYVEDLVTDCGLGDSIATYGDLAFAKKAIDSNPDNEGYQVYRDMFFLLKNKGFDINILQRLD